LGKLERLKFRTFNAALIDSGWRCPVHLTDKVKHGLATSVFMGNSLTGFISAAESDKAELFALSLFLLSVVHSFLPCTAHRCCFGAMLSTETFTDLDYTDDVTILA